MTKIYNLFHLFFPASSRSKNHVQLCYPKDLLLIYFTSWDNLLPYIRDPKFTSGNCSECSPGKLFQVWKWPPAISQSGTQVLGVLCWQGVAGIIPCHIGLLRNLRSISLEKIFRTWRVKISKSWTPERKKKEMFYIIHYSCKGFVVSILAFFRIFADVNIRIQFSGQQKPS